MKSLNFARYKFLKFIFLSCLLSLLIVIACGFVPEEVLAETITEYHQNYEYSTPGEHVIFDYNNTSFSIVSGISSSSPGVKSFNFRKNISFSNVDGVMGIPYYVVFRIDLSNVSISAGQGYLLANNGSYNDTSYERDFDVQYSVYASSSTSSTVTVFEASGAQLDGPVYEWSGYFVPYYNTSYNRTNNFDISLQVRFVKTDYGNTFTASGIDFTCSITPVLASDYLEGFNAGQTYANGIVNTESASYLAGINKGLDDAKEIVDVDSASYQAGFLAGTSLDYHAGYQAGIDYANSVVNQDSLSYKQGYADGYQAGYSDGISDAKHGIWANATLGYSITYANSNGDREYSNLLIPIEPYLTDTVFYISQFRDWILSLHSSYNDGYVKNLVIDIRFANTFVYNEANYPFDVEGSTTGYELYITTINGNRYDATISDVGEVSFGSASGVVRRMYISMTQSLTAGFPTSIVAGNNTYYLGYESGKDAGLTEGYRNGYNEGYEDGFDNGVDSIADLTEYEAYQKGYDQALEDNPPGLGFDRVLTGIADTQINTITSLLNFEIFGVNLLGFFGGVLTLIIAIFIFKKFV